MKIYPRYNNQSFEQPREIILEAESGVDQELLEKILEVFLTIDGDSIKLNSLFSDRLPATNEPRKTASFTLDTNGNNQ